MYFRVGYGILLGLTLNLVTGCGPQPKDAVSERIEVEVDTQVSEWIALAQEGDGEAASKLGRLYAMGEGVTRDPKEAAKWFRIAAEKGVASGQHGLGYLLVMGSGVEKDFVEARRWFELAAAQGYEKAQYSLGLMYSRGEGVSVDWDKAAEWYLKAAQSGYAPAQHSLAVIYFKGDSGGGVNWSRAYYWCYKSAAQNDSNALITLKDIEDNIPADKLEEGKAMLREEAGAGAAKGSPSMVQ